MAFFILLALIIFVTVMIVHGILVTQKRRVANSYCYACSLGIILEVLLTIYFAATISSFSAGYCTIIGICIFINIMFVWLLAAMNSEAKGSEISFKDMLFKIFLKKEDLAYQEYTSKKFATMKKIQYISKIDVQELIKTSEVKRVIAEKKEYVLFKPLYGSNGKFTNLEWYGEFSEDREAVEYLRILTNKDFFSCITNLEQIICQLIELYIDSVNDDWFINPYGFALELEGEIVSGYQGKARLVITDKVILNKHVEYDQKEAYKKKLIDEFLEDFIGANFIKNIADKPKLKKQLEKLESIASDKFIK